jgi:mannose-6-phosphate isomerase-like protein (cupin superfamily)
MTFRAPWIANIDDLDDVIDRSERLPFRFVFEHGSLQAGVYMPGEADNQRPHNRDEAYVVMAGSGHVIVEGERVPCRTGDFIFVPAHAEHRFEDYTPDLALWVLFYGPEGGEEQDHSDDNGRAASAN